MPCLRANSRMIFAWPAALMSLLGVKWSGTSAIRAGSNTLVNPAFSNSAMPSGAVMSLASTRSSLASMMSPGVRLGLARGSRQYLLSDRGSHQTSPAAAALLMART